MAHLALNSGAPSCTLAGSHVSIEMAATAIVAMRSFPASLKLKVHAGRVVTSMIGGGGAALAGDAGRQDVWDAEPVSEGCDLRSASCDPMRLEA